MQPEAIFEPMGALALLTGVVLTLIPFRRFGSGFKGETTYDDFRVGESSSVPDHVRLPNRNFVNLLEAPVLFYVICLMFFVAHRVTPTTVALAWSYVALRVAHSVVHLTYNDVFHRFLAYLASNVALIALWATFFVSSR
jgi:hypothetical protein